MDEITKQKILYWLNKHGKISPVFLQMKLKINYTEAKKLCDALKKKSLKE